MIAIQVAWFLASFVLIGIAARTAIADVVDRKHRQGRSWERPERVSGRY